MTLPALMQLGEHIVEMDGDVLDIGRRIREGDELWRGDPLMDLRYNFILERFEVWGVDANGDGYLAASAETCDHGLLMKLAAGDWQRGREAAMRVVLHERNLAAEKAKAEADARGEIVDRLGWAIRRDLHGTRRFFGQVGRD